MDRHLKARMPLTFLSSPSKIIYMSKYGHLHLTEHQLRHLLNELNGYTEQFWLRKAIDFPLDVERVQHIICYREVAWLVHKLKPYFASWLQTWLSLYFTVLFSDSFETQDLSKWTSTDGTAPTVQNVIKHHGTWAAKQTTFGHAYYTLGANKRVNARAYFYFSSLPVPGSGNWWIWLLNLGNAHFAVRTDGTNPCTWDLIDSFGGHNYAASGPSTDKWYCGELCHGGDTAHDELFINEISVLDTGAGRDEFPPDISFGEDTLVAYITYYIDCVVVSDAYIGPERRFLPLTRDMNPRYQSRTLQHM